MVRLASQQKGERANQQKSKRAEEQVSEGEERQKSHGLTNAQAGGKGGQGDGEKAVNISNIKFGMRHISEIYYGQLPAGGDASFRQTTQVA